MVSIISGITWEAQLNNEFCDQNDDKRHVQNQFRNLETDKSSCFHYSSLCWNENIFSRIK